MEGHNRSGGRASGGFGEQGKQVFFGHVQDAAIFGAGDGVHEGCFFLLQFQDSLLNGVLGDELVHLHMGLLADAVGPVCGLILGRLIPPGVKVDDDVRRCQVQPGAAGLQRDEEHRGCPGVEGFHQLCPLFFGGRALQGEAGNVRFVQPGADSVQHGGKLGEQQNLVTIFHHGLTQLHAGIQLAGFPLVVLKAQVGVTADLPQPGQSRQNLQFSLLPVQFFHRGLHAGAVDFPLLLR